MKTTSFVIGSFKFTAAQVELFDRDLVGEILKTQQENYIARKHLDGAPVKSSLLRRYAKACARHIKARIKEAQGNDRQLNKLAKTLSRRMKITGKEFLLALEG